MRFSSSLRRPASQPTVAAGVTLLPATQPERAACTRLARSKAGPHNTPADFLHFEMLGGADVGDALSPRGRAGNIPLQHQHGGGRDGSHNFIRNQGRWRYAASLHSWRPRAATLRVLNAVIVGLARATG